MKNIYRKQDGRENAHLSKLFEVSKVSQISQVETKELPNIQIILKVILNSVKSNCHVLTDIMEFIDKHTKNHSMKNLGQ